jgi:group II intron reverse transcriptase/maturase
MAMTTLAHHIDLEWLREAHRRTRKSGAVGVDGQSGAQYAVDLESNLERLLNRLKSGEYLAPAVRRVHIPKADGRKTRPIGIPTFEDKVLQRAVVMTLEAVYEQDFLDCSYGFRPGRSAHTALDALWRGLMNMGGGWVLELDIESFFDTVEHGHLRSMLDQRVRDGVLRRTIDKWLKAGVLEEGSIKHSEDGTPQGGVISPLLANIYLHHVLDRWFASDVQPRLSGKSFMIRYADDAVLVFSDQADARRVMEVLPKRFGKYGLRLHPEKTRLCDFRSPAKRADSARPVSGARARRAFDMLGLTHYWGRSRKGRPVVKRKTSHKSLTRALKRISQWCRYNRHRPIAEQHAALTVKVRGHYAYFGVTGNVRALSSFVWVVMRIWRGWLSRRGNQCHMPWHRFAQLLARFALPTPRIVHSVYRHAANP